MEDGDVGCECVAWAKREEIVRTRCGAGAEEPSKRETERRSASLLQHTVPMVPCRRFKRLAAAINSGVKNIRCPDSVGQASDVELRAVGIDAFLAWS